ncbi:MAG: hypothetical protein HOQ07_05360 [Sinomonas sp.]|nr:hypothetical protein [Sinomonas sp.]
MSDINTTVIKGLLTTIRGYESRSTTLEEVQAALQSAIPLLENDASGVAEAVRQAEADIEEIQYAVLLDEQRPAAILRLDEFRAVVQTASDA